MLDYHGDPFRAFVVISRRSSMLAFVVCVLQHLQNHRLK